MNNSICILVIGKQKSPHNVLRILHKCLNIKNKYKYLSEIHLSHLEISASADEIINSKPEWTGCIDFCVKNDIYLTIIPLSERITSSIVETISFSGYKFSKYEFIFLLSSDNLDPNIDNVTGELLHSLIVRFNNNNKLCFLFDYNRCFALIRTEYFNRFGLTSFVCDGYTCRYPDLKTVKKAFFSLFKRNFKYWEISTKKGYSTSQKRSGLKEILRALDKDLGKVIHVLKLGDFQYQLDAKPFEEYLLEDVLWMLELDGRLIKGLKIDYFSL
jgi:hypothetical protein